MPTFHFEIVDGYKIKDPVGLECKDESRRSLSPKT
jgi:hypothetical protein